MASTGDTTIARSIGSDFEAAEAAIHGLLDSLSEEDWHKQSLNPGWTNGEILAHIVFGFVIVEALLPLTRVCGQLPDGFSRSFARLLDLFTGPFNRVNALGARVQGRAFGRARIGRLFDRVSGSLLKKAGRITDAEWRRGMHFPVKWDPNFCDFMTLEKLFHYPVVHLEFHLGQIAR